MGPTVSQPTRQATPPAARPAHEHRLGPLVLDYRPPSVGQARAIAAVVLVGGLGLLAVAVRLTPDSAGMGTHHQLGLPPCGMLVVTKLPCPTCGMTTAFAHTVRGQWIKAILAQPMGWVLAVATGMAVLLALRTLVAGKVWTLNWYRVSPTRLVFTIFALFLVAWAFRIVLHLHATAPLT
jgi:hypothetical protein